MRNLSTLPRDNPAERNLGGQRNRWPGTAPLPGGVRQLPRWVALAATCLGALLALPASAPAAEPSFSRDIWPIFRQRCWGCHSGEKAEGKLRFDSAEHLTRGGESGPLFQPGQPGKSKLLEQVSGTSPAMPPEGAPLTAAQVDLLRGWISAGGKIDQVPVDSGTAIVVPEIYQFAPAISSVAISPDGQLAACACRSEAVVVWLSADAAAPHEPLRLATDCDLLTHVEFSPDGSLLAVAGGTPARFGQVRFYRVPSGELVATRQLTSDTLFRGNFAPDGRQMALGGSDGAAYLVPIDPAAEIQRIELHSDWVVDAAFTPDGSKLLTVGRDKTTKVADVAARQLLRTIDTVAERVNAVATDGTFAVSAGLTRALTAYELPIALQNVEVSGSGNGARPVSRAAQYTRAMEAQPGEVLDLAVSGDRRLLAVAGKFAEVRLFTIADRKRVAAVPYPTGSTYAIALNADGSQLLVARPGQLDLFQLPAGTLLRSLAVVPVQGQTTQAAAPATAAAQAKSP